MFPEAQAVMHQVDLHLQSQLLARVLFQGIFTRFPQLFSHRALRLLDLLLLALQQKKSTRAERKSSHHGLVCSYLHAQIGNVGGVE